jgi:hypothetical protein
MTNFGHDVDEPPSPQAIAALEDAFRAFAKAFRAIQLYLPNNPTRAHAIEQAKVAFGMVWRVLNPAEIHIRESSFEWESRTVYVDTERGTDGLPWLLYRDGLRTLQLHEGFEHSDLDVLLALLHKSRTAAADDDDLVTLLWVADLATVECRRVEQDAMSDVPMVAGSGRSGTSAPISGGAPLAVPGAESPAMGDGPPPGMVRIEEFDTTLYFLDDREASYLQEELQREYSEDHRRLVLASLFDVIEGQPVVEAQLEALGIVDQLLIEFLTSGDYELVAFSLREASAIARRIQANEAVRHALSDLPARLSDPAVMSQLLQALDESARTPVASLLEGLFVELRPSALEPLVAWLGLATSSPARPAIERASKRLAGAHTSALAHLLEHHDEFVVRGAVRLSAQLATPAAVPGLVRLLRGSDVKLRIEAIQALGDVGSPAALQAIERGIDDSERDVRVAVYRALAARTHTAALPRLLDAIRRKELRTADLSEKMALFEAFGGVCGDAGVGELDKMLNARGLLGSREPSETRACAARALGMVGTPTAMAALQRASDTKDVVVRSAVVRAIRGSA